MSQNLFESAKKYAVKESVSYADGSVVSKIVARNEAGNITLFAFDKGQNLSEHTAPFDALVQVIEGEARIRIAGIDYMLSEGDMIIMPASVPHAVEAVSRFKMMLTMLKAK
jgi:quercetin dioxygenase-like cupin family protein